MRLRLPARIGAVSALIAASLVAAPAAQAGAHDHASTGLTTGQRATLYGIARDTWRFFEKDVDAGTHLPLDNLGPGATRGEYTSSANIGVYLWSVVSARDLGLISTAQANDLVLATLRQVQKLQRGHGFLYQWYDTSTRQVILNPGQGACPKVGGTTDNCSFLSGVDNGWYASGLIVARQALPATARAATSLLNEMDFSIFYDNRPQTDCNVNPAVRQPADGADVRRLLRRRRPGGLPQRRHLQRSAHRDVRRHGSAPDARRRLVADLADAAAEAMRHRPRLLLAGPVAGRRATGRRSRTRSPASRSRSGRATTPTPAPRSTTSRPWPAACSRR